MLSAGCDSTGSADGGPDAGPQHAMAVAKPGGSQVRLALLPPNAAGATAAASGMLAVRGRCIVLEAGGTSINLAFATAATGWDDQAGQLRVGNRSFAPGTTVAVGGALFTGDPARLRWLREPAAECRDRRWIVASIDPSSR
jgi:hypothetical protein